MTRGKHIFQVSGFSLVCHTFIPSALYTPACWPCGDRALGLLIVLDDERECTSVGGCWCPIWKRRHDQTNIGTPVRANGPEKSVANAPEPIET